MPTTYWQQTNLDDNRLDPAFDEGEANELPVNLAASTTYAKGEIIGETATPGTFAPFSSIYPIGGGAAPAAPTLTHPNTGALAAGTYTVRYRFKTADGRVSPASTAASVTVIANDVVHVAAVTLPAGATAVEWYMSGGPGDDTLLLALENNGAAADLALPASGAKPLGDAAFSDWNTTRKATMILRYKCVTDADGLITYGSGDTEFPNSRPDTNAYISGIFKCEDVHGLTQEVLDMLGGRLLYGDLSTGVFRF